MLTLAGKALPVPILQGGMGVGVSLGGLAGAVAACGGMGCISTADAGYREPDFARDPAAANCRALAAEVQKAKRLANGRGLVAVNAMVATQNYAQAVATAVQAGADAVDLRRRAAPGAARSCGPRQRRHCPHRIQQPGSPGCCCAAGQISTAAALTLWCWKAAKQAGTWVLTRPSWKPAAARPWNRPCLLCWQSCTPMRNGSSDRVPVFVAGGVYTGADIARYVQLGAAGAQLATRFITTYECDASQGYKDVLLHARQEDLRIIHSPVGMPARALNTPLVQKLAAGQRFAPRHCARCLKGCDPAAVPYCITQALIAAVQGDVENGLFFCGSSAPRLDRMRSVRELMDELLEEWRPQA